MSSIILINYNTVLIKEGNTFSILQPFFHVALLGQIYNNACKCTFKNISMKVRIFEKIYHPTNKPCTPSRRKREEHWIRQLGTAAPYGCNDHIDNIGNLTSPGCQSVNVLNLFDRTSRRHRRHGSRRYNTPEIHNVSFDGLLSFVNLQLGLHHIRTRLYSLPLKTLHVLYESTLTLHFTGVGFPEHRLQGYYFGHFLKQAIQSCQGL